MSDQGVSVTPTSADAGVTERESTHNQGASPPPQRGAWVLVAVALGVMMVGIDGTVVSIANPYIARSLHGSLADLQWVTNAYLLVLAILLIPMGYLGDRYGRKRVFLIGVVGFALSSLAVGVIGSMGGVIFFRAVQGMFGAMLMPNSLAIIRTAFPGDRLNRAVGIWGGATALSIAAGPIVGGLLVEHISWQSVFYINAPVALVATLVGLAILQESRAEQRPRFDAPGLALLGAALFCVVFGLIKASTWGWGSAETWAFLGGGLALLGLFASVESKVAHPLLPMRLFRNVSISVGTVSVILAFLAMFGLLFFITLYLQNVHGYDPVEAGIHMLPLTAVFVVASPLGGFLNERFGPRVVVPGGMTLVGIGLLLLLSLQQDSSYIHLWPSFLLAGFGVGTVIVASADVIVGSAPATDAGVAGGLQSTAVQLGGVLGTSILGSVLATKVASSLFPSLLSHGVPASAAHHLQAATPLVTEGSAPVVHPASFQHAVAAGSHAAFMAGLHQAIFVAAIVSFLAAGLGLLLHRSPHDADRLPAVL